MINILLGVTGSIAAYKAAELANILNKTGASVKVIMTRSAVEFITPLTFQTITKHKVYTELFETFAYEDVRHISLAQETNLLLIAPATANIIGKLACGIADDMLTTVAMAVTAPKVICPAMNTTMYENAITQGNIKKLEAVGYIFVEPRESLLACGDVGKGAMADIDAIIRKVNEVMAIIK